MKRKLAYAVIGGAIGGIALTACIAAVTSPEDTAPTPTPTATEAPIVVEVTGEPTPTESPLSLPPCPTEDSDGCYWDADTMGNHKGTDSVTVPIPEYPTEGMPDDFNPDTDSTPPIPTDPASCEANGKVTAEDGSCVGEGFWNDNARQDYDTGILDCGVNAAPAVDQDPWGNWWAYCEPALINEDGSHWDGVTP